MKRTVILLVGPIASGKGEAGKYLARLGFSYFSLSDRVREEARSRDLPLTRENLQNIGNELRERFGGHILAERTLELIKISEGPIVLDSIRNPAEITYLKENLDQAIVFGIVANTENRLAWYLKRAEERGEDGLTEADFYAANNRDLGIGEPEDGQQVGLCLEMADVLIQNEGSKNKLREEIDYHLILDLGFSPEGARRARRENG